MKDYIYKLLVKLGLIKLSNIKLPFTWLVVSSGDTKGFVCLKDAQKHYNKEYNKGNRPLIKPITARV